LVPCILKVCRRDHILKSAVSHLMSLEAFIISQLDFDVYNCDLCVIRYKVEVSGKSLPVLTNLDKGKYGVIVFENLNKYLQMDKWNRELLDKYCREYSVGIVGFNPPSEETLVGAQLRGFPLFIHTNLKLKVSLLCLHTCLLFIGLKRGVRLAAAVVCKG